MRGVDEIWHLGDVCHSRVLSALEALEVPLHVVAGNCDARGLWPETLTLERVGLIFFVIHIPLYRAPAGVDVLLHGHTHVPRDEMIDGCRFLNPGAVGGADKGSPHGLAIMELQAGGRLDWQQRPL